MEIQAFRLHITQAEMLALIERYGLGKDHDIEKLNVELRPDGVVVTGYYPLFISVKFEMLWELEVSQGRLRGRLADFRAMGVPATIFRSAIVKQLDAVAKKEPALSVEGDTVIFDADACLSRYLGPTRMSPRSVLLGPGWLVLEAGTGEPG